MRKYLKERFREIVKLDDPPHKLALAVAIGIFVAFSPWIGLHIVSCIFFAWIFRVSKVVVLTATFVNNPWTVVPLYAFCLWFGVKITGSDLGIPHIDWANVGYGELFTVLKPFLWPFVAGTLAVGAVAAALSYFFSFWAIRRYRRAERDGCGTA